MAYMSACSTAFNPKRPLHLLQCYCHIAMATTPAASKLAVCAVATYYVCRYESYEAGVMAVLQALGLHTSLQAQSGYPINVIVIVFSTCSVYSLCGGWLSQRFLISLFSCSIQPKIKMGAFLSAHASHLLNKFVLQWNNQTIYTFQHTSRQLLRKCKCTAHKCKCMFTRAATALFRRFYASNRLQ